MVNIISDQSKSISDVDGVYCGAICAGIKKSNLDLGFIYVPDNYSTAGVFTKHMFPSSSVVLTKKHLKNGNPKVLLVNSGNANVATGADGEKMTKSLCQIVASSLGCLNKDVAIAATGIIGKKLPNTIIEKVKCLLKNPFSKEGKNFEKAILTTDAFTKSVFLSRKIGKKLCSIAGVTKGCGMIEPNMATTLGFLVTDLMISKSKLQDCLKKAMDVSYNCVSVDSDMSTSDMVLIFSTGKVKFAEHDAIQLADFQDMLNQACIQLAKKLVRDGEGASKLIECHISGTATKKDACLLGKQIINSPLVKTAVHGENPNWGRIIMAIGKNPAVKLNPKKVSISFGNIVVFQKGNVLDYDLDSLNNELKKEDVYITVDCGIGPFSYTCWGCDLTKEYVGINMEYN